MKFALIDFGDPVKEAQRLREVGMKAADTKPVMWRIAYDMMRVEGEIFASQGRRGGGSWKPLKSRTARRKGSTIILIESSDLVKSMSVPGAKYQQLKVTNYRVNLGTSRPWAFTHQFGSIDRNIPRRPFVKFESRDVDRWRQWIYDHILRPHKVR
jgi:phage gpG-like protein